jgi:hypothetical protein
MIDLGDQDTPAVRMLGHVGEGVVIHLRHQFMKHPRVAHAWSSLCQHGVIDLGIMEYKDTNGGKATCDVFTCAHVPVHEDSHLGFPWNQILYLGPLNGNLNVKHRLWVIPQKTSSKEVAKWRDDGTIPQELMQHVIWTDLTPGTVVQLDMQCPHWMEIHLNGGSLNWNMQMGLIDSDISEDFVAGFLAIKLHHPVQSVQPFHTAKIIKRRKIAH